MPGTVPFQGGAAKERDFSNKWATYEIIDNRVIKYNGALHE